jgi:hypothetical protein
MGTPQKSGFARTSGFENYKLSGFANYSRPLLLAPQQPGVMRPGACHVDETRSQPGAGEGKGTLA